MKPIQKIFTQSSLEYVNRFGSAMPANHRKALLALENCRTERMGKNHFACPDCGSSTITVRSCGNRHCPSCQTDKGYQWLDINRERLLPCSHFMVTFTVPQQLRRLIRSNQRLFYPMMFSCAWQSMRVLARDPKHLGVDMLGAIGVLHTWTRQIEYHPHIHFLVPAGGLDKQGIWVHSRQDFFLPVRALSVIFRAKMRDAIAAAGMKKLLPDEVWHIDWNVNCENKGNGHRALSYLSAYLFRVAIGNNRIVRVGADSVTFKYQKQKSQKYRTTTVSTLEFIRRFLQHVLPKGFVKVRHFGFLSPSSSVDLEQIAEQILDGFVPTPRLTGDTQHKSGFLCSCGARMKLVAHYVAAERGGADMMT